ncbi:hypothetical protein DAPPUDRAFT_244168 [Daphnia pulex]|uniref:G-protein coupled receptors family 1 profile domain-containing protein n=1 Tax=Daphnia pulex TaxID=6669 RepID=E9GKC9_DAPPU|nr:hypothetical protein DAPPUDRAFT_244168 [Daphnia pulex]|eukprot:EFX79970.1 hypothetical protein DAPPUDRAFT_244168 [Daphnia pulex]
MVESRHTIDYKGKTELPYNPPQAMLLHAGRASPSWYDKIYLRPLIVLMILGSWLFSFLMMMPPLLGIWNDLGLNPATFSCTILPGENGKSPKKFFAFGFLITCVTVIVSYTCIFIKPRNENWQQQIGRASHQANVPVMKSVKKPGKKSTSEKHLKRDYLRLSPHDAHHPLLLPFLLPATHGGQRGRRRGSCEQIIKGFYFISKKTKLPVIHVMSFRVFQRCSKRQNRSAYTEFEPSEIANCVVEY